MSLVKQLQQTNLAEFNFLKLLTLSNYITLVDSKGQPVIFEFNGKCYFFSFNKQHYDLNLNNHKNDFKFFEKLYLLGLFKSDFSWKNLIQFNFFRTIKDNTMLEPRNLSVNIVNGCLKFHILSYEGNQEITTFNRVIHV